MIVGPLASMLGDPGGAAYLRIQAELLAHPARADLPPLLAEPWSRPGLGPGHRTAAGRRYRTRSRSLGDVRRGLVITLVFHTLADRARVLQSDPQATRGSSGGWWPRSVAILETPME